MLSSLLRAKPNDTKRIRYLGDALYRNRTADSSADDFARQAFDMYKRGAQLRDPVCELNVANCLYNGIGVQRDSTKALEYYKRSASSNNAFALRAMGVYYRSIGNHAQSMLMYHKAAENGDIETQNVLGNWYFNHERYEKAVEWYSRAAEAPHASKSRTEAQNSLGLCYAKGLGVRVSKQDAARLFEKARQHGDANAECNILILQN